VLGSVFGCRIAPAVASFWHGVFLMLTAKFCHTKGGISSRNGCLSLQTGRISVDQAPPGSGSPGQDDGTALGKVVREESKKSGSGRV